MGKEELGRAQKEDYGRLQKDERVLDDREGGVVSKHFLERSASTVDESRT